MKPKSYQADAERKKPKRRSTQSPHLTQPQGASYVKERSVQPQRKQWWCWKKKKVEGRTHYYQNQLMGSSCAPFPQGYHPLHCCCCCCCEAGLGGKARVPAQGQRACGSDLSSVWSRRMRGGIHQWGVQVLAASGVSLAGYH